MDLLGGSDSVLPILLGGVALPAMRQVYTFVSRPIVFGAWVGLQAQAFGAHWQGSYAH